jgi:uncharacterized protein YbbK (DUF523 family)
MLVFARITDAGLGLETPRQPINIVEFTHKVMIRLQIAQMRGLI